MVQTVMISVTPIAKQAYLAALDKLWWRVYRLSFVGGMVMFVIWNREVLVDSLFF